MPLPIPFYIPNILGYARIVLSFVGLYYSTSQPDRAVAIWIFSASLDLIDGLLARFLRQSSSLGVLLDIAADNILRTTMWVAAALVDPSYRITASIIISVEWITMVSTQLHASQSGSHWKKARESDPWIVKSVFADNFRRPLGILCIYGLFGSSLLAFVSSRKELVDMIPYFHFWKYLAFSGRLLSISIEMWLVLGYLRLVIERDNASMSTNDKIT